MKQQLAGFKKKKKKSAWLQQSGLDSIITLQDMEA